MTHATNRTLDPTLATLRSLEKVTPRAPCSILLSALVLAACSASGGGSTSDAPSSTRGAQESAEDSSDEFDDGQPVSADATGKVTLGQPYVRGSCASGKPYLSDDQRYASVIFNDQTCSGNPLDPEFWRCRSADRLVGGDAKSLAPACELHIPMQVTAGYKFSPTNVIIRGFAYSGFVYSEYRWGDDPKVSYAFEKPEDGGEFRTDAPLYNLWSPTCGGAKGSTVSTELVAILKPFTAEGKSNSPIIAVDYFGVSGFGRIDSCSSPPNYDQRAKEGEACGIVDYDDTRWVNCETTPDNNLCVFSPTNTKTGVCVNQSKTPKPTELEVGYDAYCGGPFYKYCSTKDYPLVCAFKDAEARQNASTHFGKCVTRLSIGSQCSSATFGACDGYSCNTTLDPCEAGSTCNNGTCVATQKKKSSTESEGAPGDDSGAGDDSGLNNDSGSSDTSSESGDDEASGSNDSAGWNGSSLQSDDAPSDRPSPSED